MTKKELMTKLSRIKGLYEEYEKIESTKPILSQYMVKQPYKPKKPIDYSKDKVECPKLNSKDSITKYFKNFFALEKTKIIISIGIIPLIWLILYFELAVVVTGTVKTLLNIIILLGLIAGDTFFWYRRLKRAYSEYCYSIDQANDVIIKKHEEDEKKNNENKEKYKIKMQEYANKFYKFLDEYRTFDYRLKKAKMKYDEDMAEYQKKYDKVYPMFMAENDMVPDKYLDMIDRIRMIIMAEKASDIKTAISVLEAELYEEEQKRIAKERYEEELEYRNQMYMLEKQRLNEEVERREAEERYREKEEAYRKKELKMQEDAINAERRRYEEEKKLAGRRCAGCANWKTCRAKGAINCGSYRSKY